jgi:hypothetical protein
VRDAPRLVHRETARPAALRELEAETALSHAGRCDDAHDLARAARPVRQRRLQDRHLPLPADEAGEAAGARHLELRAQGAQAFELVHSQRVAHARFRPTAARRFEEQTQALRDHGLDPQSPPDSGRVYFKDPDGVILQLS